MSNLCIDLIKCVCMGACVCMGVDLLPSFSGNCFVSYRERTVHAVRSLLYTTPTLFSLNID